MAQENHEPGLDGGLLVSGFVIGLLVGVITALFNGGSRARQGLLETGETLRDKLESIVPTDPIAESLAEGKAAARRRRAELGLEK